MNKEQLFAIGIVCLFVFSMLGCNTSMVRDPLDSLISGGTVIPVWPMPDESEQNIQITISKFREAFYGSAKLTIEMLADVYAAVDKKEEVIKMEQLLKDLENAKAENNTDEMKRIYAQINKACESVKEIDLEKEASNEEKWAYIIDAALKADDAIKLHKVTIKLGKELMSEETTADVKDIQWTEIINVLNTLPEDVVSLIQIATCDGPKHIGNLTKLSWKFGEFIFKKGLNKPTEAEKEKLLKENAPSLSEEDYADL